MDSVCTTTRVFVQGTLIGEIEYEILPNGKILQFQGLVPYPQGFCKKFRFPVSSIDSKYEGLVCKADWLVGGNADLGFLTLDHLEDVTVDDVQVSISEPKELKLERIFNHLSSTDKVHIHGISALSIKPIANLPYLQSRYETLTP